jgi:HAD superfamily hydrolase (TIGR01509 family)
MIPVKHVIFDCDGVLVDSEALSMEADRELLAAHGIHLSFEQISLLFIGKSMAELIASIEHDYGIKLPADFSAQKDARILAMFDLGLEPVPGIRELLKGIRLPLSVASNSPKHRVEFSLLKTGLAEFFGNRITAVEDVVYPKPAPDIYLLAAKRAGVAAQDCLVVEDSVTGTTAAAAAGCSVVGFTATYADKRTQAQKLLDAGAWQIIAEPAELARLL